MHHHRRSARASWLATLFLIGTVTRVAAATLEVRIDGVREAQGHILVQIAEGPEVFDGSAAPVAAFMLEATPPAVSFSVDLAPGTYGMRVLHDLDGDGELDTNFVGMPKEPWAFSNNARGRFGPPAWDDVTFEVTTAPDVLQVELIH